MRNYLTRFLCSVLILMLAFSTPAAGLCENASEDVTVESAEQLNDSVSNEDSANASPELMISSEESIVPPSDQLCEAVTSGDSASDLSDSDASSAESVTSSDEIQAPAPVSVPEAESAAAGMADAPEAPAAKTVSDSSAGASAASPDVQNNETDQEPESSQASVSSVNDQAQETDQAPAVQEDSENVSEQNHGESEEAVPEQTNAESSEVVSEQASTESGIDGNQETASDSPAVSPEPADADEDAENSPDAEAVNGEEEPAGSDPSETDTETIPAAPEAEASVPGAEAEAVSAETPSCDTTAPEAVASVSETIQEPAAVSVAAVSDVLPETAAVAPESSAAASPSVPTEGVEGFVYRMYQTVLQREPDQRGFDYWVKYLKSGDFTAADVVSTFFNSREYQSKNKPTAEVVTDFYQTVLDRSPDIRGFNYWKARLDVGMTTDYLIYGFMNSPEFTSLAESYGITPGSIELTDPLDYSYDRTYFVYRLYQNCLGRTPDLRGQRFWCEQLGNGLTGSEIAHSFIFSKEYYKSRHDNNAFVEMLYKTLMGRASDAQGFKYWTKKLNYTDTRERVVNQFVFTPEFKRQCDAVQMEMGSPFYEPDDTVEWKRNIEVLKLCNEARTAAGLPTLYTREDLLWDLAMARAEEITDLFSHTRPDGTLWSKLFVENGFAGYIGENLAGGQTSSQQVFNAWMNSAGHRNNILNPGYVYLSTGFLYDPAASPYCAEGTYKGQYVNFKYYWAQSFCSGSFSVK